MLFVKNCKHIASNTCHLTPKLWGHGLLCIRRSRESYQQIPCNDKDGAKAMIMTSFITLTKKIVQKNSVRSRSHLEVVVETNINVIEYFMIFLCVFSKRIDLKCYIDVLLHLDHIYLPLLVYIDVQHMYFSFSQATVQIMVQST